VRTRVFAAFASVTNAASSVGEPTSKIQGIAALYEQQNAHKHPSKMREEETDSDFDSSDEEDSDDDDGSSRKRRGKNNSVPFSRRFINDLGSIQLGVFQAMLRLAHSVRVCISPGYRT
jgi:hypothetical protein